MEGLFIVHLPGYNAYLRVHSDLFSGLKLLLTYLHNHQNLIYIEEEFCSRKQIAMHPQVYVLAKKTHNNVRGGSRHPRKVTGGKR